MILYFKFVAESRFQRKYNHEHTFIPSVILSSKLKLNVCVCVCVRGNKKSIENLLVNVVYLFICGDYQESKQFS